MGQFKVTHYPISKIVDAVLFHEYNLSTSDSPLDRLQRTKWEVSPLKTSVLLAIAFVIVLQPLVCAHAQDSSAVIQPQSFSFCDTDLPFFGQENPVVTIDVFSDYQCPACKNMSSVLEEVLEKYPYKVKVVFKNYPLPQHRYAGLAAAAALAAGRQEKFSEFHRALFQEQAQLNVARIDEIAERLELDMRKFREDVNDPGIKELIVRDVNETRLAGVRSTPTVFVNGKRLKDRSLEGFSAAIDSELAKEGQGY